MSEKGFLQDVRHNLWDILPGWGRRSGLRQLNSGEISHKVGACRLREWFFRHALALPAFYIFFIYQGKLCLFFNNFFPWENVFSFITRDYDSLLLSICTTFIQFTHIFWRFNKNFLTFFSQNDILYSSIERTFEYWRKEWSANHVESEVCGRRPSGQYLKYSDTGLFL